LGRMETKGQGQRGGGNTRDRREEREYLEWEGEENRKVGLYSYLLYY
jgi:hypothetical protein